MWSRLVATTGARPAATRFPASSVVSPAALGVSRAPQADPSRRRDAFASHCISEDGSRRRGRRRRPRRANPVFRRAAAKLPGRLRHVRAADDEDAARCRRRRYQPRRSGAAEHAGERRGAADGHEARRQRRPRVPRGNDSRSASVSASGANTAGRPRREVGEISVTARPRPSAIRRR